MPRDLRLGLDVSGARRRRLTGWERFALEYVAALERMSAGWCDVVPLEAGHEPGDRLRTHLHQLIRYTYREKRQVEAARIDVLHALTFPPGRTGRPTVWTIHDDLLLGGHPDHARLGAKLWVPLARRALGWTERVVVGTRSVAADLVQVGVHEDDLRVVTPGVPELDAPARPKAHPVRMSDGEPVSLPDEFLLAVGTIEARKRPRLAARVADMLGVPILIVGRVDPSFDGRPWPPGTLRMEAISDGELSWLYRNATVFLSLSSYEGLDFPLLEALSVGTPAVASDIPVHRELASEHASLVDAHDPTDIVEAVRDARAPSGLQLPTWQDCVDGYQRVYAEVG